MTSPRIAGCGTAIVTPFNNIGAVDEAALRTFVEWQLQEGVNFIVPCGSTGEAATLSIAEHRRVVEIVVEQVAGRVPVVAGAGSNDTAKAISLSKEMKAVGATHLLQVTPMYNRPPQRALVTHFRAIADAVDLPIVLYNVPGRTGVNLEARTVVELSNDPRFCALKEAAGNLTQLTEIIRDRAEGFSVLSGDDAWTIAAMAYGGDGIVSVTSNATPKLVVDLVNACVAADYPTARKIDARLARWTQAAFVESNPMPVKAGLSMMGKMQNSLRLPLVPLANQHLSLVRAALEFAGVLEQAIPSARN
jgi:4-hydroxy-tetrahydrodipicolinate synthase